MARGEGRGGPQDASGPDDYVSLRIGILLWRVRLGTASVGAVVLIAGESVGLLFAASLVLAFLILAAGSAMARLETRIRSLRPERRR